MVARVLVVGCALSVFCLAAAWPGKVQAQLRRPAQEFSETTQLSASPTAPPSSQAAQRRQRPVLTPTVIPAATWEFRREPSKRTYELNFDWLSISGATGYAVGITEAENDWEPEKPVTIRSARIFPNLQPGVYFVHIAALLETGVWTPIYTWKTVTPLDVSAISSPTPTPHPTLSITSDSTEVQSIRSRVEEIINALRSANNGGLLQEDTPAKKRFTCNCDKTCKTVSSCSEAYFQLNTCGCAHLDADQDGVPCLNKCGD